jgi:hypothetical protein
MNLLELVHRLRVVLNDEGGDTGVAPDGFTYFWESDDYGLLHSNESLTRYINEGCQELARRRPIRDRAESDLTVIDIEPSVARYAFSDKILAIDEILLESTGEPLTKSTNAKTQTRTASLGTIETDFGEVREYTLDFDERTITLYDTPDVADSLALSVRRLPRVDLTWDDRENGESVEFYTEAEWSAVVDWAAFKAFRVRDIDTYNIQLSVSHKAEFSEAAGPRIDFRHQRVLLDVSGARLRTRTYY